MSQQLLSHARVTLVSALAWRVIAEVMRRHDQQHRHRLVQFHPGSSLYGVIKLELFELKSPRVVTWVEFNLGGPSGTYMVPSGKGRRSLTDLLGEEPSAVIDDIEAEMGLARTGGKLPPSSERTVGLRIVAGLLERVVFEPTPWRASLATWDWNGGEYVDRWHERVLGYEVTHRLGAELEPGIRDRLRELVLVHASVHGGGFDNDSDPRKRAIAVDLASGRVSLVRADDIEHIGEAKTLYTTGDRRLHRVIRQIESAVDSVEKNSELTAIAPSLGVSCSC